MITVPWVPASSSLFCFLRFGWGLKGFGNFLWTSLESTRAAVVSVCCRQGGLLAVRLRKQAFVLNVAEEFRVKFHQRSFGSDISVSTGMLEGLQGIHPYLSPFAAA